MVSSFISVILDSQLSRHEILIILSIAPLYPLYVLAIISWLIDDLIEDLMLDLWEE